MPPVITCSAILNPCFNVSGVELFIKSILTNLECFDDGFATKAKQWFNDSLEGLYNIYYTKYGNLTQSTIAASSSRSYSGNPMTNLLNKLKEKSNKRARNDRLTISEYERYVNEDFILHLEPHEFAASEPTFSTSRRVLSIRRTRLTPASLEMCMCLKDHMDATKRIQHTSNLEYALDFEEEILDEEVQENEATPLFDEEITLDEAGSKARSHGSGSGGEAFDMTLSD
ncbi:zinc finger BED domain-containing protein RICESLEEPER 2 [Tanacetum coccineum]